MINNDYVIRLETENDYHKTENLVREAFWNVYRPGCVEHYVLNKIRKHKDYIPELAFVLEKAGEIVGQTIFVKAEIALDNKRKLPILTMDPISIFPKFQKMGYGKLLLDYSLKQAKNLGYGAVCFEGNIDFYGKSGFTFASEYHIRYDGLSEEEDASFFLCKELIPGYLDGVTGSYTPPHCYNVDESDVDKFDKNFDYKEKLILPGQLFN